MESEKIYEDSFKIQPNITCVECGTVQTWYESAAKAEEISNGTESKSKKIGEKSKMDHNPKTTERKAATPPGKQIRGFTDIEERRLRLRMVELGVKQKDVAAAVGIALNDVSKVVRGNPRNAGYAAKVYGFLGLKPPSAPEAGIPEEARLRRRLLELGLKQNDVATALGIYNSDVSNVVNGKSRSPRYVTMVYDYLGLERPGR